MDARIDVFNMFNLKLGEAHVIRVGGGRAPDALRSLIASEHVLGTNEVSEFYPLSDMTEILSRSWSFTTLIAASQKHQAKMLPKQK